MTGLDVSHWLKKFETYGQGAEYVQSLVDAGQIVPVKASGTNGRSPVLYKRYRLVKEKKDYSPLLKELQSVVMPPLSIAFYENHLAQYEKDRQAVLMLNDFLIHEGESALKKPCSINERSWQIFHDEKLLKSSGQRLLKNLGLSESVLNFYNTYEPLISCFIAAQRDVRNVLIVENLDTFVTIRKILIETGSPVLGTEFDAVIYGAGKKLINSFQDLLAFGDQLMDPEKCTFWYFGDLDYEGIRIYHTFFETYHDQAKIRLFTNAYLEMLEQTQWLQPCVRDQKYMEADHFWTSFDPDQIQSMKELLEKGGYIPQECLRPEILKRKGGDWNGTSETGSH